MTSHPLLFIKQFLRSPRQLSAVVPSGPALTRRMAQEVQGIDGPVLELGPGTGTVTKALLEVGIAEENLHLIEIDRSFAAHLRRCYPAARVYETGAQNLLTLDLPPIAAIVSGLPLLSFNDDLQQNILDAAFAVLPAGAPFVQVTYGFTPPVRRPFRQNMDLRWRKSERVYRNLPPACVYTFRQ